VCIRDAACGFSPGFLDPLPRHAIVWLGFELACALLAWWLPATRAVWPWAAMPSAAE
jgi:hypothetical protein